MANDTAVEKKVSYIGSRLREKSTYGGLAVALGMALPFLQKYIPTLSAGNIGTIVDAISSIGIGIGILISVFLPEKGNPVGSVTNKVVSVLLFAFALSFLLANTPSAYAQPLKLKPLNLLPKATPAAATTAAITPASALAKFMADLQAIQQDVVSGTIADLNAADADAAALTNATDPTSFKDAISHACYPAAVKFLQSLPVATPTTGKYVLVQLFQKKRDFVAQIQAGLPTYLKLGCAPLLGDEATIFAKLMGLVGVSVSLNTLMPGLGLAIPAL